MTRVVAYVDGFNLYHGLKAGYGRRYHWLDLQALVRDLLRPGQELLEVQYFTARVRDNLDAESRQALYLEALMSHSLRVRLIEGHFQDKPRECRNCGARWMAYEEKETDVNIAIAMYRCCQTFGHGKADRCRISATEALQELGASR
jgi:hypothetical protein